MPYLSRAVQIGNRPWDPFSPFKRTTPAQIGLMSLATVPLTDELLDGISITRKDVAAHWISEKTVHQALSLSHRIENTRYFLGAQVVATRDDIRQLSHIIVIESNYLYLTTTELGQIKTKLLLHEGEVRRACLCLNNYSGKPSVLYSARRENGTFSLYFNGQEVSASSQDVDFPFVAWSQEPKGRVPMTDPTYGLISYKCRTSGKLYIRAIDASGIIEHERELAAPQALGGADFAIHQENVLVHIDAIISGKLVPMLATSADSGKTFSAFAPVDMQGFQADAFIPAASPVTRDYHGNFHVPVATLKDGQQHLFDVHAGDAVETMLLDGRGFGYNLLVFPKSPESLDILGRGDGLTDGIGIIATTICEGKLLISNSQAGGFHYPQERVVNHDMTQMFSFRATECCYTRAQSANMVSMDYVFIESNDDGDPVSNSLWLETWDMPLPQPQLSAVAKGNSAIVSIEKDAWFENGKTTFSLSDPRPKIIDLKFNNDREAVVTFDSADLVGKTISFDMKNFYYWHQGSTVIR